MSEPEGIPPRSWVRKPIMDRTPRPIDRFIASQMVQAMGYQGDTAFLLVEKDSVGRELGRAMGFTHVPENAQDHYWRLLCADGVWYFQFVDYSPREESNAH